MSWECYSQLMSDFLPKGWWASLQMKICIVSVASFVIWVFSLFLHRNASLWMFFLLSRYFFRCAIRLARQCIKYQTLWKFQNKIFLQSIIEKYFFLHFNKSFLGFSFFFLISFSLCLSIFFLPQNTIVSEYPGFIAFPSQF